MFENQDKQNNICFIRTESGYEQITYAELCKRRNANEEYKSKKFFPFHGMLMEVSPKDYTDFYKSKRRQKYIDERSVKNGDFSYNRLTTDDFNGEDILIDDSEDIATQVVHKIMLDKLSDSILLLSDDEQELINALFFRNLSERKWSDETGIPQKTINDRKHRIIAKLKKYLEN